MLSSLGLCWWELETVWRPATSGLWQAQAVVQPERQWSYSLAIPCAVKAADSR
jgi:hypothetical protein